MDNIEYNSPEQAPLEQLVYINYTNWRGETAWREILPISISFETTEWHKDPQWLLLAYDLGKQAERSFAIQDILEWQNSRPMQK